MIRSKQALKYVRSKMIARVFCPAGVALALAVTCQSPASAEPSLRRRLNNRPLNRPFAARPAFRAKPLRNAPQPVRFRQRPMRQSTLRQSMAAKPHRFERMNRRALGQPNRNLIPGRFSRPARNPVSPVLRPQRTALARPARPFNNRRRGF